MATQLRKNENNCEGGIGYLCTCMFPYGNCRISLGKVLKSEGLIISLALFELPQFFFSNCPPEIRVRPWVLDNIAGIALVVHKYSLNCPPEVGVGA